MFLAPGVGRNTHAHAYICMQVEARGQSQVSSFLFLHSILLLLFLKQEYLTVPAVCQIN